MHVGVHGVRVHDISMLLFRASSNFAKGGWLKEKKKASSVAEQNYMHRFRVRSGAIFKLFAGNGDFLSQDNLLNP